MKRISSFLIVVIFAVTVVNVMSHTSAQNSAVCWDYQVILENTSNTSISFSIALTDAPSDGNVLLGPASISLSSGATATVRLVGYITITSPNVPYISPGGFILVPPNGITILQTVRDQIVPDSVCNDLTEDFVFNDDRVNDRELDLAAPVAIYCRDNGVKILDIVDSRGTFAFEVSAEEIAEARDSHGENKLIGSGMNNDLYILTTGELQVNAEGLPGEEHKEYVFIWDGCMGD